MNICDTYNVSCNTLQCTVELHYCSEFFFKPVCWNELFSTQKLKTSELYRVRAWCRVTLTDWLKEMLRFQNVQPPASCATCYVSITFSLWQRFMLTCITFFRFCNTILTLHCCTGHFYCFNVWLLNWTILSLLCLSEMTWLNTVLLQKLWVKEIRTHHEFKQQRENTIQQHANNWNKVMM